MSDTISKYWEDNDTFPGDYQKKLQGMIDSNPNYNGELDEIFEEPKLSKTAFRILAEYDEADIIAAANLLKSQRIRKGNNFRYE